MLFTNLEQQLKNLGKTSIARVGENFSTSFLQVACAKRAETNLPIVSTVSTFFNLYRHSTGNQNVVEFSSEKVAEFHRRRNKLPQLVENLVIDFGLKAALQLSVTKNDDYDIEEDLCGLTWRCAKKKLCECNEIRSERFIKKLFCIHWRK